MQVKDPARRFVPREYVSVTKHDGVIGDRTALPAHCGREGERLVEREATLFIALDVSAFVRCCPALAVSLVNGPSPQRSHRASLIAIGADAARPRARRTAESARMFAHLLFAADGSEGREGSNTRLCFVAKRTGDRVSVMTAAKPWSAVTNGDPSAFALRFQIICETVLVADFPAE